MNNYKELFLGHLSVYIKINQEYNEAVKAYDAKTEESLFAVEFVYDRKADQELADMRERIKTLETTRRNTGMAMLVLARRLDENDMQRLAFMP